MNFDSGSLILLDCCKLSFGQPYGLCPSEGGIRVIDQIPAVAGHLGVLTWLDGTRCMCLFLGGSVPRACGKTKDPTTWISPSQAMIGRGREQLPLS